MNNNEFDFIRDKFTNAAPNVPLTLSESVIEHQIMAKKEHKTIHFEQKRNYRPLIAAAACFIIFIALALAFQPNDNINTFKSYDELNNMITQSVQSQQGGMGCPELHSLIDEADEPYDAVTNGEYIYYAYYNSNNPKDRNKIYIFKANGENASLVKILDNICDDNLIVSDLYIQGNRLMAYIRDDNKTILKIFDITDPANPVLTDILTQDGNYKRSYIISDTVYTISIFNITDKTDGIPKISDNGNADALALKNICYMHNPEQKTTSDFMVISAIDIKNGKRLDTKAILGANTVLRFDDCCVYAADYDTSSYAVEIKMTGRKIKLSNIDNPYKNNNTLPTENLFRINENRVLGIKENENFNIGDIVTLYSYENETLTVLDTVVLDNAYTMASLSHRDLIMNGSYFALPCYYSDGEKREYGVTTLEIQNNKIAEIKYLINDDTDLMYQGKCVIINNYLYSFNINNNADDNEKLKVFSYPCKNKESQ